MRPPDSSAFLGKEILFLISGIIRDHAGLCGTWVSDSQSLPPPGSADGLVRELSFFTHSAPPAPQPPTRNFKLMALIDSLIQNFLVSILPHLVGQIPSNLPFSFPLPSRPAHRPTPAHTRTLNLHLNPNRPPLPSRPEQHRILGFQRSDSVGFGRIESDFLFLVRLTPTDSDQDGSGASRLLFQRTRRRHLCARTAAAAPLRGCSPRCVSFDAGWNHCTVFQKVKFAPANCSDPARGRPRASEIESPCFQGSTRVPRVVLGVPPKTLPPRSPKETKSQSASHKISQNS
jgi:hypothetical protein